MGIDTDIRFVGETEVHDTAKYTANLWKAGNPVNDMIRLRVVQPFTLVDFVVGRLWGR